MARVRISGPARLDLASILAISSERWGEVGRARYTALISAAMRSIARNPEAAATRDRTELSEGLRSFHIRHARGARGVKEPVHVIFYRATQDLIQVVRVLHERMEPSLHLEPRGGKRRRR